MYSAHGGVAPQTHLDHLLEYDLQVVGIRGQSVFVSFKLVHRGRQFWIVLDVNEACSNANDPRTVYGFGAFLESCFLLSQERVVILPILGLHEE